MSLRSSLTVEQKVKKIPTIFLRDLRLSCRPVTGEHNPECGWVFEGDGVATRKIDGVNVKIENGVAYQRIKPMIPDYKEADYGEITDEYVRKAVESRFYPDGIYEAYGDGIRKNKEKVKGQHLVSLLPLDHILVIPDVVRTYRAFMGQFSTTSIEGIVFHRENGAMAKIKTSDFYHLHRP